MAFFAPLRPASPRFAPLRPASPRFAPLRPASPRFAPLRPASPRFAPLRPASPRFAPLRPASPRFAPLRPASPRFAPLRPASPRFAPLRPASPRFSGLTALAALAALGLAAHPASAQTSNYTLPLTTGSDNKLDVGTFTAGEAFTVSATGYGDLAGSSYQVNPDGTLFAPATGVFSYANTGAAYATTYGGDGVNHFVGGGANYDSAGTGFPFAGPQTTDTTNPADIRFGSLVGTFSANPDRTDWFFIGNGGTFQAPSAGDFYLAVNDSASSNNSGSYAVTITAPAAVPEASTTVSFGLLLVLGLGGVVLARRKRVVA